MRLIAVLFTAILTASTAGAQVPQPSSTSASASEQQDGTQKATSDPEAEKKGGGLPVSIDKIREALEQPAPPLSFRTLDERPMFRIQIQERMKIDELLASLNFKTSPAPGGGLYGYEQQRQMFPAVDNPLRQPYAAFNQPELLTILVENLVGKYLAGKASNAISNAERTHAEANAREEVRAAVEQYCNAQPHAGAGIQVCDAVPK
jgi:hypothetical protein